MNEIRHMQVPAGVAMIYFPFFTDITDKTFLVIGGGRVAQEKVDRLRRFTDRIIVVAPDTRIEGVTVFHREYREEDLSLGDYVVTATGITDLDRKVANDCRRRGIPVNTVDDPAHCDYIFPAIIKRGDLTVAVSTAGTSPAYARHLRKEIEDLIPEEIEAILARMGALRETAAERIPSQAKRASAYRAVLAELIAAENRTSDEEIESILRNFT